MSNIEDLVRQSLQQRAEDVEPTPALWQEVDRRVARRRRWLVAAWSLAGATALVAAAVIAPTLLASGDRTPEIEPMPPGPEEGSDDGATEDEAADDGATEDGADDTVADDEPPEPAPTDDTDDPAPDEGPEGQGIEEMPAAESMLVEPVLVAAGRSIEVIGSDGRATVLEMDAEGESWIMGLAVQPGSTLDDYTAAVLTSAEGFWDLRHLHVVDGEVETWEVFPQERHRPLLSAESTAGASVTGPVFAPDGDALAWIERTPDDVALRTIGWSDGPGTGEDATDNARFTLGRDLGGFELMDWVPAVGADDGTTHWLRLASADATSWRRIPLERQADGAWSMAPGASAQRMAEDGDAAVAAVAGVDAEGRPEWLLRSASDAVILTSGPAREYRTYALPETLLPGDGSPVMWLRPVGERVVVGSPRVSAAYLVDPAGQFAALSGEVAYLDVIR